MAKIEPKRFVAKSQDGPVAVVDLSIHQEIRSDRDGLSQQYIRLAGAATSELDDFDTIIVDLGFEVFDGDERIGRLSVDELTIKSKEEPASFAPRDALQTAVSARITKVAIAVDATVISKSKGRLEFALEE